MHRKNPTFMNFYINYELSEQKRLMRYELYCGAAYMEKKRLEDDVIQYKLELKLAKAQRDHYAAELLRFKQEAAKAKTDIDLVMADFQEIVKLNDIMRLAISERSEINKSLKEELDTVNKKYSELEISYNSVVHNYDQSAALSKMLMNQYTKVKAEADAFKDEIETLKKEHDSSKREVETLKKERSSFKREAESLKKERDLAEVKSENLEFKSSKIKGEYMFLDKKHTFLKEKYEEMVKDSEKYKTLKHLYGVALKQLSDQTKQIGEYKSYLDLNIQNTMSRSVLMAGLYRRVLLTARVDNNEKIDKAEIEKLYIEYSELIDCRNFELLTEFVLRTTQELLMLFEN